MLQYITQIGSQFLPNGGAELFLRDLSYEFNDNLKFRKSICLNHNNFDKNFCDTFPYPVIKGTEEDIAESVKNKDVIIFWGDVNLNKMNFSKPEICIHNLCAEHESEILNSNKYTTHTIACSTQVAKLCVKHNINYSVILPGISVNSKRLKVTENRDEKRNLLGIKKDDFLIGMIARLDSNKRQLELIKVMNSINLKRIKAVFVGSSYHENNNYLEFLKKASTNNNCIFVPHQEDIGNWWSILDCYCMLSESEGCSAALFESLYFKVPVISTVSGSCLDLLNNKNSIIINDCNESLFRAIIIMFNLSLHKNNLNLLKQNEYKTFLKFGDIKQTAIEWKKLILNLKSKNDNKTKFV